MPVTIVGNNTPTAGGVVYGDGTNYASTAAGSAGQVLLSNGASAPSFGAVPTVNLATGVTGTLPVANGGTGLTAPGTAGNVLTSNGTAWTSAAVSSGALTLLQTVTASSSSTVDLETNIGSTYDFYLITFTNLRSSAGSILYAQMKLGGTYQTANYYSMSNAGYSNGTGNLAINQPGDSGFQLTVTSVPTNAGSTCSGEFWFSNPTNTSVYKMANWSCIGLNTSSVFTFTTQGGGTRATNQFDTPPALNGIRFYFASGTISTGVFRLYGFANS